MKIVNLLKITLYIICILALLCLFLQQTGNLVSISDSEPTSHTQNVVVRGREGAPGPPGPHAMPIAPLPPKIPSLRQPAPKDPSRVKVKGTNRIDELPTTRKPPIVSEMPPPPSVPEPFQI